MDERTLNDLLECSVCLERLDTTSKVLPCQHTFCRKCLEVIVASHTELRCPECRVLVGIKIDELPPNVLLMRLLEGMKNASYNQINSEKIASVLALNGKEGNAQHTENGKATTILSPTIQPNSNQTNVTKTSIGPAQPPPIRPIDDGNILRQLQMQQQIQLQEPITPVQSIVNNKSASSVGGPTVTPHCRALYDFISKEPGDLNFRKGDIINLRRRIDLNWFLGELNNREGAFPANHVQVVIPLPVPQCKALYDFRMGPNEEEGCLIFKKGAIINVFRRVDQNWAEGRIGDCIGIFPIAFVEMNSLAKQLMDVSAKYLHYAISTRSVPETPLEPNFSSDSSSTLTTTGPNSSNTSNSSSNSSTAPSSPVTNVVTSPNISLNTSGITSTNAVHTNPAADHSNKEKRHSFTAINASQSAAATVTTTPTNRHSSEILSAPTLPNQPAKIIESKSQKHSSKSSAHSSHSASDNITKSSSSSSSNKTSAYKQLHRHQSSWSTANTYVALYPYKAQKSDELDLKKGSVYYVTEMCQDGWYKGTNRSHKSGVFPGNYVALLRHTRDGHSHSSGVSSSKRSGQSTGGSSNASSGNHRSSHRGKSSSNGSHSESSAIPHPPPELPPRSGGSSSSGSVWSKPLGQHVEAFFSRKSSGSQTNKSNDSKESSTQSNGHGVNKKDNSNSATSTTVNLIKRFTNIKRSKSPVNNSFITYSMDNPVFEDIVTTTNTSNGSTTSVTSKRNTIHLSHPVHVRSGSCPSQLLQSLPVDINLSMSNSAKKSNDSAATSSSYMFGSQRVKGHKERPTLQGIRNNLENCRLRGIPDISPNSGASASLTIQSQSQQQSNNTGFLKQMNQQPSSSYHRKSQSLDAATISSQIVNTTMFASAGNSAVNKNKNYSYNERFRCIVSYPPNSEFELELQVGDIIYVHKKRDNGWYKGTHSRTGKVGLFPSSFVEPDI